MVVGAPGKLTLPRDERPVAQILRDIECRVPLRVHGVTLQDAQTTMCQ